MHGKFSPSSPIWTFFVAIYVLLSLLVLVEGNAKYIGLAGLVLIGTAIFSFCPIYAVLGLKTRPDGDR